jgi:hypothetical protein
MILEFLLKFVKGKIVSQSELMSTLSQPLHIWNRVYSPV